MQIPLTILPNDDGSFTVLSPMLTTVTEGKNMEETLKNGQETVECHLGWYMKY